MPGGASLHTHNRYRAVQFLAVRAFAFSAYLLGAVAFSGCAKKNINLQGYWKLTDTKVEGKNGGVARTAIGKDAHLRFTAETMATFKDGKWTDAVKYRLEGSDFTLLVDETSPNNPSGEIEDYEEQRMILKLSYSATEELIISLRLERVSDEVGASLEKSGQKPKSTNEPKPTSPNPPTTTPPPAREIPVQESDMLGYWQVVTREFDGVKETPASDYVLFAVGLVFLASDTTGNPPADSGEEYLLFDGFLVVYDSATGTPGYYWLTRTASGITVDGYGPSGITVRYELRKATK